VNDLLAGLLSVLVATNQPAALSNLVVKKTGLSLTIPDPNDPIEKEYQKLLAEDDAAQTEVDQWIKDGPKSDTEGAEVQRAALRARIRQRLDQVKQSYKDFLQSQPRHARARIAYGSFLGDIGEEEAAREQWEKAREIDPSNPAAWNNLANWYGHNSPVAKAFEYYLKAIELNPTESVYYENLATTVYLFRRDATNYFKITIPEVFDKAMALYRKALELDPENFILATHYAQSYYGFKPPRTGEEAADRRAEEKHFEEAMAAWRVALKVARDQIEREGVYLHFARLQINAGQFEEAVKNLGVVTNEMYSATKKALTRKLESLQKKPDATNAPPGVDPSK
jgi:tetratricopeptide (TPR) repeat protein